MYKKRTCLYLFSDCVWIFSVVTFVRISCLFSLHADPFFTSLFRLKELNFEVKAYENYKQTEVLDKISEGKHRQPND